MEGNMVENTPNETTWADEMNAIVISFFEKEIHDFFLEDKISHSPYWGVRYKKKNIAIEIGGDIGFYTNIYIDQTKYPLWQYDRSVNNFLDTNKKNILYQLEVLKRFITESPNYPPLAKI
ncbi:MAG: hypothetical protein WBP45_03740 [Daejeonella sp.]